MLDINPGRIRQRRLDGGRRGDVEEAPAGDAKPAHRPRGAGEPGHNLGQGLDSAERVVLVGVSELAQHAHVPDLTDPQRVLVALGSADEDRLAVARHQDGHRLEMDRDVGHPANVRRAEHGAVVAVGEEQVEILGLHERLDLAPPSREFLVCNDGSDDVHGDLPKGVRGDVADATSGAGEARARVCDSS